MPFTGAKKLAPCTHTHTHTHTHTWLAGRNPFCSVHPVLCHVFRVWAGRFSPAKEREETLD